MNTKKTQNLMLSAVAISFFSLVSNNCFALTEIGPISSELTSADVSVVPEAGTVIILSTDGKEEKITVTAVSDMAVSYLSDDGCSWNTPIIDHSFTASLDWDNCSGSSGKAKVRPKGSIFPLKKGSKATYKVKGKTTKGSWTGDWTDNLKCKVLSSVRVKTISGEHDTWKVVCKGQYYKRTKYYSPELGRTVAHIKKHYTKPSDSWTSEFVRFE